MHRKHHSALVCSQSENPALNELFQSLTGKISLVIPLLYTPALHRLLLKTGNYQLLSDEIQVVSTSWSHTEYIWMYVDMYFV